LYKTDFKLETVLIVACFYKPTKTRNKQAVLGTPMKSLGYPFPGSARMAISVLADSGVEPKNIMFLNLICAPEGINALTAEYPEVQVPGAGS
jgi:uracil phosphoribosyltransferase